MRSSCCSMALSISCAGCDGIRSLNNHVMSLSPCFLPQAAACLYMADKQKRYTACLCLSSMTRQQLKHVAQQLVTHLPLPALGAC